MLLLLSSGESASDRSGKQLCQEVVLSSAPSAGNVSALPSAAIEAVPLGGDGQTGGRRRGAAPVREQQGGRVGELLVVGRRGNPLTASLVVRISPDSTEGSARQSASRSGSPQGREVKAALEGGQSHPGRNGLWGTFG